MSYIIDVLGKFGYCGCSLVHSIWSLINFNILLIFFDK